MLHGDVVHLLNVHRFLLGGTGTRLEQFQHALRQRIRPGDIVLDLGAGTGILSFMACRAGADRVYAVEGGPIIELARLLAAANGFADRVVFIRDMSTSVELPEPVDLLITDTFATFGAEPGGLGAIIDARDRLMKPGGALIPQSIDVIGVPVEAPELLLQSIQFWETPLHSLDLSVVRTFAVNNPHAVRFSDAALLALPAEIAHLDLLRTTSATIHGDATFTTTRPGTLQGVGIWFRASLTETIDVDNSPSTTTTNYAQAFLPVNAPVPVRAGDRVTVRLSGHDGLEWLWRVEVERPGEAALVPIAEFNQSTFLGSPMAPSELVKLAPDSRPQLSPRGEAERLVLELLTDGLSVRELKERLLERHPKLFTSERDVSRFVTEIVNRCA